MHGAYRWFADESVLGFGKKLAARRGDVLYPGHPDLPAVGLGARDVEWMAVIAAGGLVAFHRDKRIRTRPIEVTRYIDNGMRSIWFGGKKDMSSDDQVDLVERHWARIELSVAELGPGPWSLTLTSNGLVELPWRPASG
ncbi:hypothetical protein [Georgenia sunbinii]|uniref:PIN-like domain-containing protein n=1 Tax=Georgenia sunbinii TaxID=3117728 RepID=UPI002F264DE9